MINKNCEDLDELQQIIADRIKDYIVEKGITISVFAKGCKLALPTLSRYISCKRTMQLDALCKIANYMGVSADYLLGRED